MVRGSLHGVKMKLIETRKLSENGQVVIPKAVRNLLDLKPQDKIDFYLDKGAILLKKE